MPWREAATSAGFSSNEETWLPIPDSHRSRAVDVQTEDPNSLLNTWRRLLHWRKNQPALMQGECRILDIEAPIFAFIREAPQQRMLCVFNLSADTTHFELTDDFLPCLTVTDITSVAKRYQQMLRLQGYGYFFGNLEPATRPAQSGTATDWLAREFDYANGTDGEKDAHQTGGNAAEVNESMAEVEVKTV